MALHTVTRHLSAALALTILAGCGKQPTMVCPTIQPGGVGDLRETRDQQRAAADMLGTGSENEIATTVATIHARHPTASKDAIVNYLVVAYCPKIAARPGLGADQKDQMSTAFAERARQVIGNSIR